MTSDPQTLQTESPGGQKLGWQNHLAPAPLPPPMNHHGSDNRLCFLAPGTGVCGTGPVLPGWHGVSNTVGSPDGQLLQLRQKPFIADFPRMA